MDKMTRIDWLKNLHRAGFRLGDSKLKPDDDLRDAVLAENVEIKPGEIRFTWLCPNCGHRHWADERPLLWAFSMIAWELDCGAVTVRMPWAKTPDEDFRSIYGETVAESTSDRIDLRESRYGGAMHVSEIVGPVASEEEARARIDQLIEIGGPEFARWWRRVMRNRGYAAEPL
jgi:hypothetical protein